MTGTREVFVHIAGCRWEDVKGTDHHLATALAAHLPVLWVDPPRPVGLTGRTATSTIRGLKDLSDVAPGITRLRVLSPPGFTRRGIRAVANRLLHNALRQSIFELKCRPFSVLVSSPMANFPDLDIPKVLYVTDDWLAGAYMMGLSRGSVYDNLLKNMACADLVMVVSPYLKSRLEAVGAEGTAIHILPNGCRTSTNHVDAQPHRRQIAAMVGQLNERIDFDVLEALQASGTPIEVVGPRTERDPETSDRLDRFLAAKNVTWLGQLSQSEVALFLEEVGVGLTPYNDSDFNRSSFPLKTLEYLAHGAPVVATDLPAVRWLDTDLVEIASGTTEFVRSVQSALSAPDTAVTHDMRRQFARQHSWDARAAQMLELIRRSNS